MPESGRSDQYALEILLSRKILLAERRALIGKIRFLSYERQSTGELSLAKCCCDLRAAMTCSYDQNIVFFHVGPQRSRSVFGRDRQRKALMGCVQYNLTCKTGLRITMLRTIEEVVLIARERW